VSTARTTHLLVNSPWPQFHLCAQEVSNSYASYEFFTHQHLDAVLEVVFEVDVNGILKVTATEKTSGRSANITISNAVGKLSSTEIENMINDAQKFKTSDEAFSKKFEGRQQLESYISRVEEMVSDPTTSIRLKRGQKEKIESALSDAMAQLEIEDASAEDLKKKELALKRVVTKAFSTR
jgi:heat shock protein 1/8